MRAKKIIITYSVGRFRKLVKFVLKIKGYPVFDFFKKEEAGFGFSCKPHNIFVINGGLCNTKQIVLEC